VTYFFVFVVTLVVGAMAALMISERLKRTQRGGVSNEQRHAERGKRRQRKKRKR
jgi:hypothetical protein